jgi:hypothetical protein
LFQIDAAQLRYKLTEKKGGGYTGKHKECGVERKGRGREGEEITWGSHENLPPV